jgi:hypothetical protein
MNRQQLLETAFSDIPSTIGATPLRQLSAGSFTLLGRLGNPMMVGNPNGETPDQSEMFEAVLQYVWVHSAPVEQVVRIRTAADLPTEEIAALGLSIPIGLALAFIASYQQCAERMQATLAETIEEENNKPGKPQETPLAGLPPSSTLSEPQVIPFVSATSSGKCPSSEPSPTSTPQTSPMELAADGFATLPTLSSLTPEEETSP